MSGQSEYTNVQNPQSLSFTNYAPADGSRQHYGTGHNVATHTTQQLKFESLITPSTMASACKVRNSDKWRPSKFIISSMELPPWSVAAAPEQPSSSRKRRADALNRSNLGVACKKPRTSKPNGPNRVEQMSSSTQTINTPEESPNTGLIDTSQVSSTGAISMEASSVPKILNKANRPSLKSRPLAKERGHATILRKDKPVATQVPLDIWRRVLEFCPLGFLLKARTINRDFRLALSYQATWRRARKRTYGHDCPELPAGLTEFQFADLVTGSGCQSKECSGTGRCRKVYWAYQRRWCENCLHKRIVMENSMSAITNEYPNLTQCVYFAIFDGWDNYQCTGRYDQIPAWIRSPGSRKGFERRAIAHAMQEIDELLRKDTGGTMSKSPEEVKDWFMAKETKRDKTIEELQTIETWWEGLRMHRLSELQDVRAKRIALFEEKAMTMEPPMTSAALHKTVSFQRAIKIGRTEPNHRSWQVLEKKLQVERTVAERLVKEEEEDSMLNPDEPGNLWQRIDGCPAAPTNNPNRMGIFAAADRTIKRLGIESGSLGIADEDIVPLVLKEIRKDYYRVDVSQTLETERSPLRLVLENAKEIYEKRLEPIISGWQDKSRERAATLLKCPFCIKKNGNTRWTFPHLMLHVGEEHAMCSTELTPWHPRKKVFPWHRIEWPLNLPIITGRQNVPGKWDLSKDAEHWHESPVTNIPSVIATRESAFKSRSVAHELGPTNHKNFIENILYAAERFRNTSLASKFVAQIVFQFALQKYHIVDNTDPPFTLVEPLQLALLRKDHHALFDGFKCRYCCEDPEPIRISRFVNRGQPFGELMHHFGLFPHPRIQWTTKALHFPSEEELNAVLQDPGQEHASEIFTELFPVADPIDITKTDDSLIITGIQSLPRNKLIIHGDQSPSHHERITNRDRPHSHNELIFNREHSLSPDDSMDFDGHTRLSDDFIDPSLIDPALLLTAVDADISIYV